LISPVVEAVYTYLPTFRDHFDDGGSWGHAKQIAAALTDRGVDGAPVGEVTTPSRNSTPNNSRVDPAIKALQS
jgi:hypothetical protein